MLASRLNVTSLSRFKIIYTDFYICLLEWFVWKIVKVCVCVCVCVYVGLYRLKVVGLKIKLYCWADHGQI